MKIVVLVAVVAVALAMPGAGAAAVEEKPPTGKKAQRIAKPTRCPYARTAVAYYRGVHTTWRAKLGLDTPYPAGRKPRNCADAQYLSKVWIIKALKTKVVVQRWLKDQRTLYDQPTWIKAIDEVQKAYPGTRDWLRSCSASEGAGRSLSINYFVMNHQGSGAGGYLQFMSSTFWRMYTAAVEDLKERGFSFPASSAAWDSRLGQAMAGAWGVTHGRRGEWSGSGC